jgi:hypothetical protein
MSFSSFHIITNPDPGLEALQDTITTIVRAKDWDWPSGTGLSQHHPTFLDLSHSAGHNRAGIFSSTGIGVITSLCATLNIPTVKLYAHLDW